MTVLAIIPARGGSKGLPRKNLLPLAGLPLLVHALRFAEVCPEIDRTIVSTDDAEIAEVARGAGGEVPALRPPELARDDTPMWPVLRHALEVAEADYDYLVLLDPTAPGREPGDLSRALAAVAADPEVDGAVTVAEPEFNIVWQSVVIEDGRLRHLIAGGDSYVRRQDAPRVLRISGVLYVWRTSFVRNEAESWFKGRNIGIEIPEVRAFSIDLEDDLRRAEALVAAGLMRLPWAEASATPGT